MLNESQTIKTITILSFLLLVNNNVRADEFCVTSAAELATALSQANSNNQDNHIKIKSDDYSVINNEPFEYFGSANYNLTISGGWTSFNQTDCFLKLGKPIDTTLDGNNTSEVLYIQNIGNSSNITVENLTISNGYSETSATPGGLEIYTDVNHTGKILVDRILFIGNQGADFSGGALHVLNGNEVTIRNSIFTQNIANNGFGSAFIGMASNQKGVYFINNSMLYNDTNSVSLGGTNSSGLSLNLNIDSGDTPSAMIANNLFWSNEGSDFWISFSGGLVRVYNNNYQNGFGNIDTQTNNFSLEPKLSNQILNFTPQEGSPLIDQGLNKPSIIPIPTPFFLGYDYGTQDFDAGVIQRVHNGRVDIGAVESAAEGVIFKHGFE